MSALTETAPVPWDKPKPPSTEVAAVVQAAALAEAMLTDEAHADPLSIKTRANAAILFCDELNWIEAKREFAYVAICCDWRWAQDNPRVEQGGDRKSNTGVVFDPSPIPPTSRQRTHDTFDGATEDDIRVARETADADGETINRGHVRQAVESPADGVKRKALGVAQRAKVKRAEALKERHEMMLEMLEDATNRAQAVELELSARDSEDNEHYDDVLEEMSKTIKSLIQAAETRTKQLEEFRDKWIASEAENAGLKKWELYR